MEFSELALQLIILLIPGIIHMKVYRSLQVIKEKKDWEDYFEMIFISIVCYVIYSLFISINISFKPFSIDFVYKLATSLIIITSKTITINLIEVFFATIIATALAYLFSYLKKQNIINIIGMKAKVTERYGDDDLWHRFISLNQIEWVTVRDFKAGLDYFGKIKTYSETDKRRELILHNVTVFKDETNIDYVVDILYLSREFDDLNIEYIDFNKEEGKSNDRRE